MYVQRRVDDRQCEREQPGELEEARAEGVDVGLQDVGVVDQEVRRLLAPAYRVQACGDHVLRLSTWEGIGV